MKKLFISFLLSLLGLAWANAQYSFECEKWGDYEALTDATSLTTIPSTGDVTAYVVDGTTAVQGEAGTMEQATLAGIPIGFDFEYYGTTFDKFIVSAKGYIKLGAKTDENITFSKNLQMLNRMLNLDYCIGVTSDIPVYECNVSYKMTGEAGQRMMTIQFDRKYDAKGDQTEEQQLESYKHQICLFEEDNHIEIVFGGGTRIQTPGFTGQVFNVGLKGSGTTCYFANYTWNLDYVTDCHTNLMKAATQVPQVSKGTTFIFDIVGPCDAPTYTVSDITLSPKSDEMGLTVVVDTAGKQALGYVVVASEQPIEGAPEDGMDYSKGNALLGGTVVCAGSIKSDWGGSRTNPKSITLWEFSHPYFGYEDRLTPNTTYYYAVYFSNTGKCLTTYSEGTMVTGKTATTAPAGLEVTSVSLSEVTFSATANELGEEIAILMTSQKGADENDNRIYVGNFAHIPADAEVGDKFETSYTRSGTTYVDSTVVLYKGPAKAGITCPVELKSNKMYYFGAASKGAESGLYSSLTAEAEPYLTPAVLPFTEDFKDFSFAEDEPFIGGWEGTTNFGGNGSNSGTKSTMGNGPDQAVLVIPALDFPTDSNVLVNIAYSVDPYGYNSEKVEGDSIALEISTDGGKTFKVLKAVHKNTDNLSMGKVILSDYLGAKQAILRFRAVNANPDKAWNVSITKVSISALPFCPEPGKPYVSTTYGGTLGLTWYASENNETQWNISTAPAVAEDEEPAWSRALVVNEKPYYLTGLADREIYNVRVQAICGTYVSGWVESKVQAGRVPTFKEDFNNLPVEEGYYGPELEWPALWTIGYYSDYYATSDEFPEKLQASNISSYYYVNKWEYKTMNEIEVAEEGEAYNGSVGIDMDCLDYGSYYSGDHTYGKVIATPVIELNAAEQPKLVFDMAYGRMVNDELTAVTGDDIKVAHKVMLWASADSGRTFNTTNPIQTWDGTALAAMSAGQTITVDLSAYEGLRAFALGIQPTLNTEGGEEYLLWVDNIGIINGKPMARNVKVLALTSTEATIRWVADPTVEEWIVKVTGGNLTAPKFYTAMTPLQVVEDLIPEMEYTVAVSHIMDNDTVDWNAVTFMTPGMDCDEPTELAVSEITRKSAKLTWEGNAADGYRVRYRPVATEGTEPMTWLEVEVEGTSYILNGLALETEYECGVQSVCNKLGEQESEYAAFDNFTTQALTCFAPTDMRILEIKPKSIDISWTGTSDNYQVAWMPQASTNAWKYSEIISEGSYTITDLDYYSFYTFKVRGVCAAGDSSEWSETRNFRTLPRQACPDPTNLRVEALTQTSATLLWDAEEIEEGDIQSFILRHRLASVQAWDSIKDVKGNSYAITDMMPKTAYVWAVMTGCLDNRYSENWAQLRFETLEETSVEGLREQAGLYVATAQGQVYIMNPQSVQIDNIRIYATTGRRLEQYAVRSNDNVILTTKVRNSVVIVEIESAGRFFRFKTLLP